MNTISRSLLFHPLHDGGHEFWTANPVNCDNRRGPLDGSRVLNSNSKGKTKSTANVNNE